MLIAIGFLFGCFIGSFLNVCIHRLPRNLSVVHPPSRCGACGTRLAWYDNLPVIGYLMLRGHCRWCGTSFSPRYLIMEILVGALTALVVWWGAQAAPATWLMAAGMTPAMAQGLGTAVALAFVYMLFVAAVIDLDHLIIPDELTVLFQALGPVLALVASAPLALSPLWSAAGWVDDGGAFALRTDASHVSVMMLWLGLGAVGLLVLSLPVARWVYDRWCPEGQRWTVADHRAFAVGVWWFAGASAVQVVAVAGLGYCSARWAPALAVHAAMAVLGSLMGWWVLYGVGLIGTVAFRRNAMGFGDVKFLAPIGALLGPIGVLFVVAVAALVGTVVGIPLRLLRAQREIPFGPSLAVGALVVLIYGERIGAWLAAGR